MQMMQCTKKLPLAYSLLRNKCFHIVKLLKKYRYTFFNDYMMWKPESQLYFSSHPTSLNISQMLCIYTKVINRV